MEIVKIMKVELKIEEIDYLKRLGREKIAGKTRGILVTLTTIRKKMEIIRNTRELKNTNISVREHFSKEVADKRKELWNEAKVLRKEGKYAVVKFDKLVVKERQPNVGETSKKKRQASESPEIQTTSSQTHPDGTENLLKGLYKVFLAIFKPFPKVVKSKV
ncbi:hypothetical protein WDU94_006578 [Cyamophila willieti]